jgi:hypothetical protein
VRVPEPISTGADKAADSLFRSVRAIFRVRSQVRRNNRSALRIHEDLTSWARDDLKKEERALDASVKDLARRRLLNTGEVGAEENRIRGDYAVHWRDRKRQADRDLEDLKDSETALHRTYRRLRKNPWPENPDREEVENITRSWEERLR